MDRKEKIKYEIIKEAFRDRGFDLLQIHCPSVPKGVEVQTTFHVARLNRTGTAAIPYYTEGNITEEDIDKIALRAGFALTHKDYFLDADKSMFKRFANNVINQVQEELGILTGIGYKIEDDYIVIKSYSGKYIYRVAIRLAEVPYTATNDIAQDIIKELKIASGLIPSKHFY